MIEPGHSGKLNHTDEEMEALVEKAHKKGFQVITHAIGDRANQQILDAYETVLKKEWNPDHRFRIEHFQLVNEKMVKQTRDLGVLVGMQAIHAPKSGSMADRRIGTERAVWSYASGIPTGQVLKLSVGRMHRLHREIRSGGFTQRVREKTNMESQRADGMHKIAFHCWQQ